MPPALLRALAPGDQLELWFSVGGCAVQCCFSCLVASALLLIFHVLSSSPLLSSPLLSSPLPPLLSCDVHRRACYWAAGRRWWWRAQAGGGTAQRARGVQRAFRGSVLVTLVFINCHPDLFSLSFSVYVYVYLSVCLSVSSVSRSPFHLSSSAGWMAVRSRVNFLSCMSR